MAGGGQTLSGGEGNGWGRPSVVVREIVSSKKIKKNGVGRFKILIIINKYNYINLSFTIIKIDK